MPNEVLTVEVEMRARDALKQFERLDQQFRETAGANKALYKELWTQHKKYVAGVERENKKRVSDEAWLSRELSKEEEKRKRTIRQEAKEQQWLSRELKKEVIQRAKDERWLTKELQREQEQRERATKKAVKGFGLLNRAGAELAGTLGAFSLIELAYGAVEFGKASARAAIQIDSQTRALAVLTGSASEAKRVMQEIQDLADEPGLRFRQAVDGAVALRAIGTEAETTTRILKELANAAAFSGGEGEFERGLLGFRQLIQRGRLSQEELNQLTENLGLASKAIKEEFGTVLAEDIQAQLDDTGQNIDDFVERTLTAFERLERFPLDAPSVKLKNLSNSFFEFQAAVGDTFLPAIASGAEGLTELLDALTGFISYTDKARDSR